MDILSVKVWKFYLNANGQISIKKPYGEAGRSSHGSKLEVGKRSSRNWAEEKVLPWRFLHGRMHESMEAYFIPRKKQSGYYSHLVARFNQF